jgi:hypothetical protein
MSPINLKVDLKMKCTIDACMGDVNMLFLFFLLSSTPYASNIEKC